jgi:glycosyltransferase involved in cell wall biosynthesis
MNNVSFVIPTYNCASLIEETIFSILDGNLESGDEIIIIDDCSTDNTWPLLQDLATKHSAIKIFKHDYNKGTAAAGRNTAIGKARHEIIFALDADNLLEPRSIAKLKSYLIDNQADAVAFGELWFFKESKENLQDIIFYPAQVELADFFAFVSNPGSSGNYMFTKSSWVRAGYYFEPKNHNQTLDSWSFALWQVATGSKMLTMPNSHYLHRQTPNSHYLREMKRGNVSLAALAAVLPFLDLLSISDREYITSKNRLNWYDDLWKRPLKLVDGSYSKKENIGYNNCGHRLIHPREARSWWFRLRNKINLWQQKKS